MKKVFRITTVLLILVLVVLNSLFAFVLLVNRTYIQSSKTELISNTNYVDIETRFLYKDQNSFEWIGKDELKIDGNYFDVLKVVDLGSGKSRVYIYGDGIESSVTKTMKHDQLNKNSEGKKQHHTSFSDLLKLKTYTKHSFLNTFLCSQDLIFRSLCINTEEGHFELPYHPPAV